MLGNGSTLTHTVLDKPIPAGTPRRRDVKPTSRNGHAVAVPIRHEYDVVTTSHLGLKTTSTQWQEYDVVATSYLGRQTSTQM